MDSRGRRQTAPAAIEMEDEPQPIKRSTDRRKSFLPDLLPKYYKDDVDKRVYKARNNRPRWVLHMQAVIWRFLMQIGMFLHRFAPPRPPKPNFYRMIDTKVSGKPGQICLYFYVPGDYETQKKLWTGRPEDFTADEEDQTRVPMSRHNSRRNQVRMSIGSVGEGLRRKSRSARRWGSYPVIINFHGGGFTLGSPHDDARWCGTVVTECNAVVVSVDYRLAPEHPFPTAVEDGVDAVMWIHKHAEELGIDKNKILLSGFSSGANMAFTVPLRLYDQLTGFHRDESDGAPAKHDYGYNRTFGNTEFDRPSSANWDSNSSSSTQGPPRTTEQIIDPNEPPPAMPGKPNKTSTTFMERSLDEDPKIRIRGIVPWYPSLDYTRTREERRATCVRTDQELAALFTNLFDDSYLYPPKDVSLDSPYLSPGIAPTSLLRNALPNDIIMHTCEWDMLLDEGQAFHQRLISHEIDKNVIYTMVPEVPHGWDKAPNPLKPTPGVKEYYLKACKEMRRVIGERNAKDDMTANRQSIVN